MKKNPIDDWALASCIGISLKALWYVTAAPDHERYMYVRRIPKKNGGERVVFAPTPTTKAVLQKINTFIDEQYQVHLPEYVAAYRTGKTIRETVRRHIPDCHICDSSPTTPPKHKCPRKGAYLQIDLQDFFHSTRKSWVRDCFHHSLGMERTCAEILSGAVTVKSIDPPQAGIRRPRVPQGAPTSGSVCNLVAHFRVDLPLVQLLEEWNERYKLEGEFEWVYTRYADDLAFTCGRDFPYQEKVELIHAICGVIRKSGYRVNPKKTRIRNPHKEKRLLGITFNQKVSIPREEYLRIRAIVHNCTTQGVESQAARAGFSSVGAFDAWLRGKIAYIRHIDPKKGSQLHGEYVQIHARES